MMESDPVGVVWTMVVRSSRNWFRWPTHVQDTGSMNCIWIGIKVTIIEWKALDLCVEGFLIKVCTGSRLSDFFFSNYIFGCNSLLWITQCTQAWSHNRTRDIVLFWWSLQLMNVLCFLRENSVFYKSKEKRLDFAYQSFILASTNAGCDTTQVPRTW